MYIYLFFSIVIQYKLFLKWQKDGFDSPWDTQDIEGANTLLTISR